MAWGPNVGTAISNLKKVIDNIEDEARQETKQLQEDLRRTRRRQQEADPRSQVIESQVNQGMISPAMLQMHRSRTPVVSRSELMVVKPDIGIRPVQSPSQIRPADVSDLENHARLLQKRTLRRNIMVTFLVIILLAGTAAAGATLLLNRPYPVSQWATMDLSTFMVPSTPRRTIESVAVKRSTERSTPEPVSEVKSERRVISEKSQSRRAYSTSYSFSRTKGSTSTSTYQRSNAKVTINRSVFK